MTTPPSENNPLIGMWKLISATAIHANGTATPDVYGTHPVGYITYTSDGHMMVMFARSDRSPLSQEVQSPLSPQMHALPVEELAQAFTTFSAYAGTYTLSGNTVTHQLEIASIPNRVGTALVRTFTLSESQVTLRTSPVLTDGVETVFELVWERI
ncbi:lipocalin-like domain-containing protein [Leptolyngbya sp. FACHB-671]|uniref:lipocalin-like domain-containing protein n=1 Tax=Leptolyngbya sp. FACHB-671 TaxID=2692812 RepID=UPI0016855D3A|nr:lipocalin-like domain-containing protein [Leptolyngbya sp. FACHB-671]MBD2066419.1 lipocalin-like domain-containing protein [Leptolyngbya sp. FACHB-671]